MARRRRSAAIAGLVSCVLLALVVPSGVTSAAPAVPPPPDAPERGAETGEVVVRFRPGSAIRYFRVLWTALVLE